MARKKKTQKIGFDKNSKPDKVPAVFSLTMKDLDNAAMSPKQFGDWLHLMGWNTSEEKLSLAGKALDKTTRQLRKYISGDLEIPRSIGISCIFLYQTKK